jgi:amino acid transporter
MLDPIYEKIHTGLIQKIESSKTSIHANKKKYGLWLIWFSCILSIAVVLSPLSSDFAMNLGVAGILFLGEQIIEKHFDVDKTWKFAYYASQFMLIISMILGLPFGLDKDLNLLTSLGALILILAILFTTGLISYIYQKKCTTSTSNPRTVG